VHWPCWWPCNYKIIQHQTPETMSPQTSEDSNNVSTCPVQCLIQIFASVSYQILFSFCEHNNGCRTVSATHNFAGALCEPRGASAGSCRREFWIYVIRQCAAQLILVRCVPNSRQLWTSALLANRGSRHRHRLQVRHNQRVGRRK
jgi:hypothetical protein